MINDSVIVQLKENIYIIYFSPTYSITYPNIGRKVIEPATAMLIINPTIIPVNFLFSWTAIDFVNEIKPETDID